jgi:uncharacterized SAM-binding protein YcdF (DUF218 family)
MRKNLFIISKRERWGLTWAGRILLLAILILSVFILGKTAVPFLSHQDTILSKVLIIEGYVEDYAYPEIIRKIEAMDPEIIITTGTSFNQGFYISGIPSSAYLIAHSLFVLGVDSNLIHIVPVQPDVLVNRTYNSALVSKKYLMANFPEVKSVNVISTSVHSRRSLYLFRKAFEPHIEVGNIVIDSMVFDKNDWHKTSRGFRTVTSELIAWFYNRLFFRPATEKTPGNSKTSDL